MKSSRGVDNCTSRSVDVSLSDEFLTVVLDDGRNVSVPLDWYPRLYESTRSERDNWRFLDDGRGIRWDDIDEDISVVGLLEGHRSGESETSLNRWRAARNQVKE